MSLSLRLRQLAPLALLLWSALILAQGSAPDALTSDGGRYFGALKGGRMQGKGRIEWPNGARYEGEFSDGLISGQGVMRSRNGDLYDGEFRNGLMEGLGRLQTRDGSVYSGDFKRDLYHGRGRLELVNGDVYQGDFENGEFHGRGALSSKDGRRYRGEFAKGQFSGQGRMDTGQGESFEGEFVDGAFTGKGVYNRPDGAFHDGQFVRWRSNGPGTFTDQNGNIFEGIFSNNELNGKGSLRGKAGFVYEGEFRAWRFHGRGQLRLANGDRYSGGFANGQYEGEGVLTYAKPRDDGRTEDRGNWHEGRFEDVAAQQLAMRNVELALYSQQSLLQRALGGLAPREPGRINMYMLALGGDGALEVFRREAGFVRDQFDSGFGTRNRSLALVNSRTTASEMPMATITSLRESLKAIAAKMNRDEDILFLFLTSHGTKGHELILNQNNMGLRSLPARELGELLRESGIGWKVVVISACYSGGFIEHIKDERTLVIAAARQDRPSFGCEDDRDFTYFGRAYFKESLPSSRSFEEAFGKADALVREWELRDAREAGKSGTPEFSFPQMHEAAPIKAQLGRWWAQRSNTAGKN